jgi:hypothetical protein
VRWGVHDHRHLRDRDRHRNVEQFGDQHNVGLADRSDVRWLRDGEPEHAGR